MSVHFKIQRSRSRSHNSRTMTHRNTYYLTDTIMKKDEGCFPQLFALAKVSKFKLFRLKNIKNLKFAFSMTSKPSYVFYKNRLNVQKLFSTKNRTFAKFAKYTHRVCGRWFSSIIYILNIYIRMWNFFYFRAQASQNSDSEGILQPGEFKTVFYFFFLRRIFLDYSEYNRVTYQTTLEH